MIYWRPILAQNWVELIVQTPYSLFLELVEEDMIISTHLESYKFDIKFRFYWLLSLIFM